MLYKFILYIFITYLYIFFVTFIKDNITHVILLLFNPMRIVSVVHRHFLVHLTSVQLKPATSLLKIQSFKGFPAIAKSN